MRMEAFVLVGAAARGLLSPGARADVDLGIAPVVQATPPD